DGARRCRRRVVRGGRRCGGCGGGGRRGRCVTGGGPSGRRRGGERPVGARGAGGDVLGGRGLRRGGCSRSRRGGPGGRRAGGRGRALLAGAALRARACSGCGGIARAGRLRALRDRDVQMTGEGARAALLVELEIVDQRLRLLGGLLRGGGVLCGGRGVLRAGGRT